MKKQILTTFFILVLFSPLLKAQKTDTIPFKGANTIIIHTKQSDSLNFVDFQRQLLNKDYFIKQANPQLFTIITSQHALKRRPKWSYSYLFQIILKDRGIIIKPYWFTNVTLYLYGAKTENSPNRWEFNKSRRNANELIWEDIMDLVRDYPHTKITYRRD